MLIKKLKEKSINNIIFIDSKKEKYFQKQNVRTRSHIFLGTQ